jgi:hypothetical protein
MAFQAGLLDEQGRHVAMHQHAADVLLLQHFAAALLEQLERLGFPGVGRIGRANRLQAGDVEFDAIGLLGDFGQLAGHVGRIDHGQLHAVGREQITLRMLEIGIRLRHVAHRHVTPP